jgi:hypothetical protein
VAGNALLQVRSVFHLARMLQPSLVVLEDVDLIFSSREINLYSSVLGELLNQMDGLRPHEDVGVVLTTNAIDRVEAAIRLPFLLRPTRVFRDPINLDTGLPLPWGMSADLGVLLAARLRSDLPDMRRPPPPGRAIAVRPGALS